MEQEKGFITINQGKLDYIRMGKGNRLLLAFHGYHNDASIFSHFESFIGQDYTIVSINLPFHGASDWKEGVYLEKKNLITVVNQVSIRFGVEKVSLLGYSMGGRVCLNIIELIPRQIERVVLIASDGLVFNPFYFFVTRVTIGKFLFKNFVAHPEKYLKFITWIRSKKLIDASRYKFFMYYLESEEDRRFLHKVWPAMSMLLSDNKKVRANIEQYQIPVYLIMGKYDRIIPIKHAISFKNNLSFIDLIILDKGHKVIDDSTIPQIAHCFN